MRLTETARGQWDGAGYSVVGGVAAESQDETPKERLQVDEPQAQKEESELGRASHGGPEPGIEGRQGLPGGRDGPSTHQALLTYLGGRVTVSLQTSASF